jgi:hypothetical protein
MFGKYKVETLMQSVRSDNQLEELEGSVQHAKSLADDISLQLEEQKSILDSFDTDLAGDVLLSNIASTFSREKMETKKDKKKIPQKKSKHDSYDKDEVSKSLKKEERTPRKSALTSTTLSPPRAASAISPRPQLPSAQKGEAFPAPPPPPPPSLPATWSSSTSDASISAPPLAPSTHPPPAPGGGGRPALLLPQPSSAPASNSAALAFNSESPMQQVPGSVVSRKSEALEYDMEAEEDGGGRNISDFMAASDDILQIYDDYDDNDMSMLEESEIMPETSIASEEATEKEFSKKEMNEQLDDVQNALHDNIDLVLERGEKLESLAYESDNLQSESIQFQKASQKKKGLNVYAICCCCCIVTAKCCGTMWVAAKSCISSISNIFSKKSLFDNVLADTENAFQTLAKFLVFVLRYNLEENAINIQSSNILNTIGYCVYGVWFDIICWLISYVVVLFSTITLILPSFFTLLIVRTNVIEKESTNFGGKYVYVHMLAYVTYRLLF